MEEVVSETEFLRQPDKDIAKIIAAVNDPHFLNRAMLKTAVNIPFIPFFLTVMKSPFNYLYEKNGETLHWVIRRTKY